ncbi:integrase, catalytic region, zinc finger, CCHC-type containing protein [Tanacetum coccineum]|uniref:Integrase, catalytic region, zinc finger, CCHC-type containing protein n=1 Tax=Tanacetum coccineum TaxID=301880 RepID=A0ABQ5DL15_9ASTR
MLSHRGHSFFKTLKEHFEGIQKALTKEIKEMKDIFEELEAEVDQNGVDRKHDEIAWKNLLISNDNLIDDCLSKEVFYVATNSELDVSSFTEMHDAHTSLKARCLELEVELSNLRDKIQKDNHNELVDRFSNLENKLSCVNKDHVKLKVLAPGKYVIDVDLIPPRNRNNREVHLVYLKHLKENVETLREIIKEVNVKTPLDSSLASACLYNKHSQELLEYVIGTCLKDLNTRDNKHAYTLLPKKKQVTFEEQCAMSKSNIHKLVEQLNCQKTNVPVPPSTGVNSCTDARRSQPRSNTKKNRILPAKSVNMKKVEEHPRIIKSSLKTTNRIDSSISSKHTVINLNSYYVFQTCNKCLISANHDMCVVTYLHSMNASPSVKNVVRKVKQVWKPTGCSKHMTGDRLRLRNFVKKFIETVKFGNDHFGAIMGYGDYVIGESVISRIYYVEGLGHNMFFVGQFCDSDLEVAFRKHSCYVRDTDDLTDYYERVGIFHQKTVPRTPQHNDVVERQNRTLVEAARTMLIFSKAPMFLWAEAVATACYTQNRSLIHTRYCKTPYELVHDKKPDLTFFRVFGATVRARGGGRENDNEYLENYNQTLDNREYSLVMHLAGKGIESTTKEPDVLWKLFTCNSMSSVQLILVPVNSAGTPSFTTIDQDAPSVSLSPSSSALQSPSSHQGVAAGSTIIEDNPFTPVDNDPFLNVFALELSSEASSSRDVRLAESTHVTQPHHYLGK